MSGARTAYVEARTALLDQITHALQQDERFVAAWLGGSFGRGEQTWISDLDLHVVVSYAASPLLCATPWQMGARTTDDRLALFSRFGTPGIIYEDHSRNPMGGTFTNVVYRESAQNVDWMLIPQAVAHREHPSLLLFDRIGLPEPATPEPERREDRIERASTQCGHFWILACGAARALAAGRLVHFQMLLREMEGLLLGVRAALRGDRATYTKHTILQIYHRSEDRIAIVRRLSDEMDELMLQVAAQGGSIPPAPRALVEMRLALVDGEVN